MVGDNHAVGCIINLPAHEMNGKTRNQFTSGSIESYFAERKLNDKKWAPKSASISCSVNLIQEGEESTILEESTEFDCFKDNNLRMHENGPRRHVERVSINLFRKQKRIKWMEMLNEEQDGEPPRKQIVAAKQEKIKPLPLSNANFTVNSTMLNHRSTSQGLSRQIFTSLEKKRQGIKKKTLSSLKFHEKNHETSLDRYPKQKRQIPPKQMKFQIQPKPMIERLETKLQKKTKQELKRLYSPSRIFHKASKSSREFIEASDHVELFKAWQLSEEIVPNDIFDYTEDLFSSET